MNKNRPLLIEYAKQKHGEQKRKYDGEAYYKHLLRVAKMAEQYNVPLGFEKGLLHDIVEDHHVTLDQIEKKLSELDYTPYEKWDIITCIINLTDEYTPDAYPNLNRKQRKQMEAERLWHIRPDDQTVKYCDMLDNLSSIIDRDPDFARVYIKEKEYALKRMRSGNKELLKQLEELI